MKKLFAANISPVYNFDDYEIRYKKFFALSSNAFRNLIHSIMLYDGIVIPTQDFLILNILVNIFGKENLLELFNSNFIQFVRINGFMGYDGNGKGIQTFEILGKNNVANIASADLEKTINWTLTNSNIKSDISEILKLTLNSTSEIKMNSILQEITNETQNDVLKSQSLSNIYPIHNKDLKKLDGIEPNKLRIFGGIAGKWYGDEVDYLMSLANANLEIKLAKDNNCDDSSTSNPVGQILKAKAERTFEDPKTVEAFTLLQEIEGVPDIGDGFYSGNFAIKDLLKIKESKNGEEFRKWFHENSNEDPHTILKEYSSLLKEVPMISSLPSRVLRFIICGAAGLIPGLGLGVSAIDNFAVNSILKGSSPKYFIDDLRKLGNRG